MLNSVKEFCSTRVAAFNSFAVSQHISVARYFLSVLETFFTVAYLFIKLNLIWTKVTILWHPVRIKLISIRNWSKKQVCQLLHFNRRPFIYIYIYIRVAVCIPCSYQLPPTHTLSVFPVHASYPPTHTHTKRGNSWYETKLRLISLYIPSDFIIFLRTFISLFYSSSEIKYLQ